MLLSFAILCLTVLAVTLQFIKLKRDILYTAKFKLRCWILILRSNGHFLGKIYLLQFQARNHLKYSKTRFVCTTLRTTTMKQILTKTTHIDSVDRADLLRLIGIRHIPSLAVFNSGKQGTTVHTVAHLPSFRYAKTVQTACWGPPPIPRQGPLTLPCKRSTSRATTRPYGR